MARNLSRGLLVFVDRFVDHEQDQALGVRRESMPWGRTAYDVRGATTQGGTIAVRVLIVTMALVAFYGCGQSGRTHLEDP